MKKLNYVSVVLFGLAALAISGCEKADEAPTGGAKSTTARSAQTTGLPATLFVTEAPADAQGVGAIKAATETTGEVVVEGRIGGRPEPFLKGTAVFLLADSSLKTCRELHGDGCPTPWDYCCEPKESLAANIATIQIVDDAGKPLRVDLKGKEGLNPMARLTIAGEITGRDGGTLVINAHKIYVESSEG
jgi:hypothetical protein